MPAQRRWTTGGSNAVVVALAAALVVAVVVAGVAYLRRTPSRPITFAGDSITAQAQLEIESRFGVYDDHVRAVSGLTIDQMHDAALELAALHPEQAVVNLGTNDVLRGEPAGENGDVLLQIAAAYTGAKCVHLVTINEAMYGPQNVRGHDLAVDLNRRIHEWAAAGPGRRVVEWSEMVRAYDAAGKPNGELTADTVHPTAFGQTMLLDAIQRSVDSCP